MPPKRSYFQIDAEIIANLDIIAEYSAMGIRFAGNPRPSGNVACYAVGRDDRHPSAWVNVATGRYGDSGGSPGGGGSPFAPSSLSLWDFAATFGPYPDWQTARRELANKAGVKLGRSKPPENWRDRLEFQSWDEPGNVTLANRWCISKKRGITVEAIQAAGGLLAYYPCFRDENTGELKRRPRHVQVVALPCYGQSLLDADPVAWVIWDVSGAHLELFRGKNVPKDRAKMLSIGPTHGTMMGLHGLQRLTDDELRKNVKLAWKTAGPTDMLAMWSVIPDELKDAHIVVTNASGEMGQVTPDQIKLFVGLDAYIDGDTTGEESLDKDHAGKAGALQWCHKLHGIAANVFLSGPGKVMEHGKDTRDFLSGVR